MPLSVISPSERFLELLFPSFSSIDSPQNNLFHPIRQLTNFFSTDMSAAKIEFRDQYKRVFHFHFYPIILRLHLSSSNKVLIIS